MGQKVNPHGLRVGVIKDWDSRWYARADQVGDLVVEDYNIRKYLKNRLYSAGIAKIEVERNNAKVKINIHCSRPGVVIGKAGAEIENLRKDMEARLGKSVNLNIVEVRSPDLNAQLVAENIAQQLEKRISFRRAMKKAMQQATRLGAKGIKVTCGGRLGGAEIARSESYHEGTIPLQTIRIPPSAPLLPSLLPPAGIAGTIAAVTAGMAAGATGMTGATGEMAATGETAVTATTIVGKEATANADAQKSEIPQGAARSYDRRRLPRK